MNKKTVFGYVSCKFQILQYLYAYKLIKSTVFLELQIHRFYAVSLNDSFSLFYQNFSFHITVNLYNTR